MVTVTLDTGRRFRHVVKKNEPLSVRAASMRLKELEEEAQTAETTDRVIYRIYADDRLLFTDQHPLGAGQPSNLLFLVQDALRTVFADEPEDEKTHLLQALTEALRAPEPLVAAKNKVRPMHAHFWPFAGQRKQAERGAAGKTKAVRTRRPVPPASATQPVDEPPVAAPVANQPAPHAKPDARASDWNEAVDAEVPHTEAAVGTTSSQPAPNPARGEPSRVRLTALKRTCTRLMWLGHHMGYGLKRASVAGGHLVKRGAEARRAARKARAARQLKALDVQLARETQKAKLYAELARDRERVRQQVEKDAQYQEARARELKKAHQARVRTRPKKPVLGAVMLLGLVVGSVWLWRHPSDWHRLIQTLLLLKNQVADRFGWH